MKLVSELIRFSIALRDAEADLGAAMDAPRQKIRAQKQRSVFVRTKGLFIVSTFQKSETGEHIIFKASRFWAWGERGEALYTYSIQSDFLNTIHQV